MMYYYEVKPCREAYIIIFFYFNILYFQRGEAILWLLRGDQECVIDGVNASFGPGGDNYQ